jgi:glycerol-3-phosphate dehydrogenase (NAD(P)+)
MSVTVLGAGAFGTALAVALAARGPVTLVGRDPGLAARRESARLPGVRLPEAVAVAVAVPPGAGPVLVALPMAALAAGLAAHRACLAARPLVACAKGLEPATLRGPAAILAAAVPGAPVAVLTGPAFAADIAAGKPTALTLACADAGLGAVLQDALAAPTLRLYRSTDVTGAELGGAFKNVIAIAAGIVIGAGLGDSARAALIARGHGEMTRLAVRMGARAATLAGLAGLGDLVLTATSAQSRNFRHGLALGAGRAPAEVTAGEVTVEGVATAGAMAALAARLDVKAPVADAVAAVTAGRQDVPGTIAALMARPLREE